MHHHARAPVRNFKFSLAAAHNNAMRVVSCSLAPSSRIHVENPRRRFSITIKRATCSITLASGVTDFYYRGEMEKRRGGILDRRKFWDVVLRVGFRRRRSWGVIVDWEEDSFETWIITFLKYFMESPNFSIFFKNRI